MSTFSEDLNQIGKLLNDRSTKVKEVAGHRVFVVGSSAFAHIVDILMRWNDHDGLEGDPRISAEGYNNVSVVVSVKDTKQYFVCEEAKPMLDVIWESKASLEEKET